MICPHCSHDTSMHPPFNVGDRVRLLVDYGEEDGPRKGDVGTVTYRWPDWQVAVQFDGSEQGYAYWPKDLAAMLTTGTEGT